VRVLFYTIVSKVHNHVRYNRGGETAEKKGKKQRGVVLINGFEQFGALNQSKKPVEVLV